MIREALQLLPLLCDGRWCYHLDKEEDGASHKEPRHYHPEVTFSFFLIRSASDSASIVKIQVARANFKGSTLLPIKNKALCCCLESSNDGGESYLVQISTMFEEAMSKYWSRGGNAVSLLWKREPEMGIFQLHTDTVSRLVVIKCGGGWK